MCNINDFYKFIDDPDLFFNESNDILTYFITENLFIAMRMISLYISEDEMKNVIKNHNMSESYSILQKRIDDELREIPNMDEFKIEICKRKLKDILSLIYKNENHENKETKKVKMGEEKVKLSDKYRNEISWNGYRSEALDSRINFVFLGDIDIDNGSSPNSSGYPNSYLLDVESKKTCPEWDYNCWQHQT